MAAPPKGVNRSLTPPVNGGGPAHQIALIRARRQARVNTPAPAAKVKTKAKAAPAFDPTALLTGRQINQEAQAAANLKYNPQIQAVRGQQRVSQQEQQNITDWFQQYKDAVDQAQQKSAAYDAGAQAAMNAQAQQAEQQAQQDSTQQSAEAQQAAAARRSTADSYGAMLAAQGSAHNTFFSDKGRIAAGEETNAHLQEHNNAENLAQQLGQLRGEKGEYKSGQVAAGRKDERTYAEEAQAFGLDVQKEKDSAAATKAAQKQRAAAAQRTAMEHDRNYQLDLKKFGAAQAKDNYQRTHGLGPYKPASGPKPTSHAAVQKATGKVQTKVQDVTDLLAAGGTVPAPTATNPNATRPATPKEVAQAVGQKYSPMWVRIAQDVQKGRPLNSAEIAYLHSQDPNVRIPKSWLNGRNQAPPEGRTAPSGAPGETRPT